MQCLRAEMAHLRAQFQGTLKFEKRLKRILGKSSLTPTVCTPGTIVNPLAHMACQLTSVFCEVMDALV